MDQASLWVNLSYVLHEPSTSSQVRQVAQRITKGQARVTQALQQLSTLPDDVFRERLVIHPASQAAEPMARPLVALGVRVGAWPLLERAIRCLWDIDQVNLHLLDDEHCQQQQVSRFFRANATLCRPSAEALTDSTCWFASLVVRPGYGTLLFQASPIAELTPANAGDTVFHAGLPLAEATIRTHVEQWGCARQLWVRPVEEELPEFRGR